MTPADQQIVDWFAGLAAALPSVDHATTELERPDNSHLCIVEVIDSDDASTANQRGKRQAQLQVQLRTMHQFNPQIEDTRGPLRKRQRATLLDLRKAIADCQQQGGLPEGVTQLNVTGRTIFEPVEGSAWGIAELAVSVTFTERYSEEAS
ncbi:MAG: hypothetical protein RJP96_14770 [Algiphilus sp.]|uniref:hypothetical protein n=1 Tax=Algiphilus sp. TaxID=1872431 RepID=UPI0032EECE33